MSSSGILRHVALVRNYVSEERSASIIKVAIISAIGTSAVTSNRRTLRSTININISSQHISVAIYC
jgi:hypothetical protein